MTGSGQLTSCPDDELLAAFVEGRLDATAAAGVESHVASCSTCLDGTAAVLASDAAVPGAADVEDATRRPLHRMPAGRSRRVLRGTIAAGLVFTAAGLVAYGGMQWALAAAARTLAQRAGAALQAPVAIGALRIGIDPRVRMATLALDDVSIGADDGSSIEHLELALGLLPLVRGVLDVAGTRIVGATLRVRLGAATDVHPGVIDTGDLAAVGALAARGPVTVADTTLVVERAGAATLTIDRVRGTVAPSSGALATVLDGDVRGGGTFTVRGTAGVDPTSAMSLVIAATGVDAAIAPETAPAGGRVTVTVRVDGTASAPRLTTSVASAP